MSEAPGVVHWSEEFLDFGALSVVLTFSITYKNSYLIHSIVYYMTCCSQNLIVGVETRPLSSLRSWSAKAIA